MRSEERGKRWWQIFTTKPRCSEKICTKNLYDAGLDQRLTDAVLAHLRVHETRLALSLLRQHKQVLLAQLHGDERRIDSLDYLIHKLQQTMKG